MKITFLGATHQVTGSSTLVEWKTDGIFWLTAAWSIAKMIWNRPISLFLLVPLNIGTLGRRIFDGADSVRIFG